jgi:hypothetical protein
MKLAFYHYFVRERRKQKAPRVAHDLRPLFKAYLDFSDNEWKRKFTTEDGEHLFLLPSPSKNVHMILGTRKDDLIQAINLKKLTCEELTKRLAEDEEAGFAGYFTLNDRMIAVASTLRGPKAAAIGRLVNHLLQQLGAARWVLEMVPIGSSVSLAEARDLRYVTRTAIRVLPRTPFFERFKQLMALDEHDVASIEVIVRARKGASLQDTVKSAAAKIGNSPIDRMTLRAKAVLDDELSDYFVAAEGQVAEHVEAGTAQQIAQAIATRFSQNQLARERLEQMLAEAPYAQPDVQDLTLAADPDHWRSTLVGQ